MFHDKVPDVGQVVFEFRAFCEFTVRAGLNRSLDVEFQKSSQVGNFLKNVVAIE